MINEINYQKASDLLSKKQFDEATTIFSSLGDYKKSTEMINEINYQKASDLLSKKQFDEATTIFSSLGDYKNSTEMVNEINYQKANDLLSNKQFDESITIFTSLEDYKNSQELLNEANYQKANDLLAQNQFELAIPTLRLITDYKDSYDLINKAYYLWGIDLVQKEKFQDGINLLIMVDKNIYPDIDVILANAKYEMALEKAKSGDYKGAYYIIEKLDYKDSAKLAEDYAKIAFSWHFTGGMTKNHYLSSEDFAFIGTLYGGKPGENIDVLLIWNLWGNKKYYTCKNVGDGARVIQTYYYDNLGEVIDKKVTVQVLNKNTSEVLATYEFFVN
jgi:hypothetical protein